MAYSALLIASYAYAAANPRVVRGLHAQDTHGGGGGKSRSCQSFDRVVATSCSRRTLLTMGYTVGDLDGVTTSAMVEIGRVNLQFVAACCGTVPFGTILPPILISTPVSTDALVCCLSATVSPQEVGAAVDPAEKLPPTLAEAGATSGMCLRALSALASVCRRFKRALAQAGVRVHILACLLLLCAYRLCAGCSGQLRSCRQVWPRSWQRVVGAFAQWLRAQACGCFKRC